MKTYKKLIYIFTTIALVITLVACDLKNLVDLEVNLLESSLVIMEGEELPTDKFEVIGIYSDGSRERLDFNRDKLRYDYDPNPVFDHFDAEDNLREQMVKFMYNNKHLVEVPIYTKRLTPTDINVISYGKTAYQYGQMFEPDDYQLLVRFEEGPNKIIDLDLSMVDLPSNLLIPEVLGTYETNIYYNGLKAGAPIRLNISKADQVLDAHDIQLKVFTKDKIVVEPIENAVYAFYPANNIPSIKEFQIENEKNLPNIATDYVVFVKLLDNQFYNESEVVSKTFKFAPSQAIPNVLFVNEETVIFEHQPNFDIVIIENGDFIKPNPNIVSGMTIIDGLLPNHSYQFGYVEKNTDILYDSNILNELVVTKPANDVLKYNNTQQFIYSSVAQNFNYSIAKEYEHLQDALEVDIKYFQNGELTSPIDVGVYDVEITYNFSREVFKTKLVVTPKDLTVYVDDTSKVYDDADPLFTLDVSESFDSITDFDYNFTRVLGENIGTYTIDAEVTNPNYNITVIPGQLEIIPRTVVVDIDNQTQVYDDEQTLLTYTLSEEVYRDQLDLELTIPSNSDVGSYDITATTSNPNFNIEVEMGTYEITPRPIDVTIDNKVITYEDSNVGLTYQLSEEAYRSELGLIITRETGNAAGTYVITATTSNPNFEITVEAGTYTIEPKVLEVTINNQTKIYGESDPTFSVDLNDAQDPLVAFNITYNRVAGEDVGTYVIEASVTNPNYDITVVAGTLEITPGALTVQVNNEIKIYGEDDPLFTLDLNNSLDPLESFSVTYDREVGEDVGTYAITAEVINPNYNITVIGGHLTITQKELEIEYTYPLTPLVYGTSYTITANANLAFDDQLRLSNHTSLDVGQYVVDTRIYDEDNREVTHNYYVITAAPTYEIIARKLIVSANEIDVVYGTENISRRLFTVEGLQYGESADDIITGQLSFDNYEGEAGHYDISLGTLEVNSNYELEFTPNTLTVRKRDLTLNYVGDMSVTYGTPFVVTTEIQEGSILTNHEIILTELTSRVVGTYQISAMIYDENNNDVTHNYNLTNATFEFEITKKVLDVTFEYASRYVGQTNNQILYGLTVTGFAYGETVNVLGNRNNIVVSTNADNTSPAGTYDIEVVTGYTSNNYDFNYEVGALVIRQISLLFEFDNILVTYDAQTHGVDITNIDIKDPITDQILDNEQFIDDIEFIYTQSGVNKSPVNVGTYNITLIFNGNIMYEAATHTGNTLEIQPRDLTVQVNNETKVYGEDDPLFTLDVSESFDSITDFDYNFTRVLGENIGTYTIDAEVTNPNYNITVIPGQLEITPRPIHVTIDNKVITYEDSNVALTYQLSEEAYRSELGLIITRETGNAAGTYLITATTSNPNFKITVEAGTYTIEPKVLEVTINNQTKIYGESDPTFSVDLNDAQDPLVAFNITYDREVGESVDTYIITAEITNPNYDITVVAGTLEITPRALTVQVNNETKVYGEDDPLFTLDLNNSLDPLESFSVTYDREVGEDVGTYAITAEVINPNYNITVIGGVYTIIVREISVTYSGYTGLTYNGQAHDILAVATNLADGDLLQLDGHDASNAGTYTATAYVYKDGVDVSNNYQITGQSIEYTIAKRTITASLLETEYEYTGQDVDLEVSFTGLISGDDLYVTIIGGGQSVGTHIVNVELNGDDQDNYELLNNEFTITITKGTLQLESNVNEVISDMQVFEYDYLNNDTTISNATLLEILGLSHLSSEINDNDPVFTGLDLSNGASTFIVDVTIPESTNYKSLETTFILKLKTVSVGTGANPTYYTIEDALLNTSSGTLVVRYHTSFAQSDVANIVYGTNNFDLESGVTLLLPYSSEYSLGTNDDTGQTANAPKIDRNNVYVNLTLTENTVLDISGKMIVNAQFTGGTPYAGYVTGANYSILNLNNNSKVNVLSDGSLYSNGFIIGSGKVEVFNGAKVYERLYIMRFRGGSITSAIYEETFPFDEFGFNNIESELIINKGGSLYAGVIVHVSGFNKSNLLLIGDSNALLNLEDNNSRIIKKYDISSGKTTFDLYGKITMSDVSVKLAVTAKTDNKDFPFPGNFSINVKENANFTLDMRIKLLPGSKVHVEEGAHVTITEKGSLMIYDGNNQYYPGKDIPYATSAAYDRFRVSPTIGYSLEDPAEFINDGYIKVEGRIAGKVTSSKNNLGTLNGIIELGTNSNNITVKSFNYSTGSSIFTTAYYDEITYYLLDYKNTVINGNNIYQVHGENEPWTIAMNFHNLDTNETTVINQPYGEKYIYPDWYNGEIMEIYADNQLLDPIGEDFNNKIVEGTIITDVYVKEVIKHTVNFEPNGGEDLDIIYVTDGDNIDLIYYTTIKSNHIFMGWYIDSDFNQKYTNQPITADITLYAKWIEGTPVITLSGPTSDVENDAGVELTATVKTQDGTPIEGVEVIFSMNPTRGNFTFSSITTNSDGVVTTTFSGPGKESYTLTATESITDTSATITVNVKAASSSGSPFLYSIDADGNLHFEHEPISHSMLKTVESATYGTLRLLESIDGKYYIEVVEEGGSITMLNGLNLYYFDYVEDSDIIDFFVDVNGHPHTIKERIAPTSFVDQNGQSYLYEVTHKDNEFATFNEQVTTPVGYYYMTFDRPNTNNAKFMITTKDNSGTLDAFYDVMSSFNAYRNLWWLEEVFMNSASDTQAIQNIFDTLLIQVEVWNGSEWVNQGSIQRGSYLLEEFLLELDLAGIHTEDLQVRISMPTNAGYIIDSVAVDYSQNAAFTYGTMTLDTALFNYDTDVLALVQNDMDDLYAQLNPQDRVRFGFTAPELAGGYTRSYGVKMSGYIYAEGLQLEDELIPLMDGKTFEEIKQIIIDSGRADLIADLPMVEEFYYSIIFLGHMDREIITEYLFNTSE